MWPQQYLNSALDAVVQERERLGWKAGNDEVEIQDISIASRMLWQRAKSCGYNARQS